MNIKRLKKTEVVELVSKIIGEVDGEKGNWLKTKTQESEARIFFSQSKPSAASKGHWVYDYFHTLGFQTLEEINKESGIMILINYVDKTYAILDGGDILWLAFYSSRMKSNDGFVVDIVIDRCSEGNYRLRPYERSNKNFRLVDVKSWKQLM